LGCKQLVSIGRCSLVNLQSAFTRLKRPHSVIGMIESHQRQVNVPEFITISEALNADPLELFRQVLRERTSR